MADIRIYGVRSSRGYGDLRFPPRDPVPPAEVRINHWTPDQMDEYLEKTGGKRRKKDFEEATTMKNQAIDLSQFDLVPLKTAQHSTSPIATITDKGKLALNSSFARNAAGARLSVLLSKDAHMIVFKPGDDGDLHVPDSSGRAAKGNPINRGAIPLRDMAKARGLPIPAKFSVEWDEDVGGYVGRYIEPVALAPRAVRGSRRK